MGARRGERYVGPYEIVMSHPVYENAWLKLREDRVKRRDGRESTFGIVAIRPGVTVLPMDKDETVTLVREFKYALGESTLEAVSGAIESGESPEQAGLREIGEEAGLVAAEWVDMGVLNPFTTLVHSPNHMFLARRLSRLNRAKQAGEDIEVVTMPFEEALRAVLRGEITHGASVAVILKTEIFVRRMKK
ncbi:MAG: NUDIX domain-containing protein [Armatimonadota bacterium]